MKGRKKLRFLVLFYTYPKKFFFFFRSSIPEDENDIENVKDHDDLNDLKRKLDIRNPFDQRARN